MARKLSPQHLQMYKPGGKLHLFFKRITIDPELSFEIRINDEVMVYYNKKKILTIKKGKKIVPLAPSYYPPGKGPSVDISNQDNWGRQTEIDKYLKEAILFAYKKEMKREFQLQQNYSLGNRDANERFLVIDMEWRFAQSEIAKEERIKTSIDLVVVDLQPNSNGENDIYLTEVKLGTKALKLQGHVNSTHEIVNSGFACKALVEDVKSILVQKHELGLITGDLPELKYASKPKMMFILGHRGQAEKEQLEAAMSKLSIPAGLDNPVVIYSNTLKPIEL